jgi:hypothetical protein
MVMKKPFILFFFLIVILDCFSQEVLHLQNGATLIVQNGTELTLQGGITLENGGGLINNGTTRLKNNSIANQSDWIDQSLPGALSGNGVVIFNSHLAHNFSGPTNFYIVQINTGGLNLNNNFSVSNLLNLINGKINTSANYVFLNNNSAASLLNDASNTGYIHSWINGNFRRLIALNTNTYDFPVGNAARCNLLQFLNNNVGGVNYLTASFGSKPGTDAGLNVTENAVAYTGINNGGAWYLTPDANASSGNYALQLYFNGFTGLADNMFGMLRRPDASVSAADWIVPVGSSLEPTNGLGRKISDGFARRFNISSFSQWGIGMTGILPCENCPSACSYTQGFYGNINGIACYNNTGNSVSSTQLMLNAFGATTFKVFGNVANRRFFTLFKNDIVDKNIFKMLPGSGNSQPIAVDNILPYDGAYYDDQKTWYLVPIQSTGSQKGKINNQLLSQEITLWFNLQTSSSLGSINLSNDTLLTAPQTSCGSGIISGPSSKFGLPHDVIVYLNGGNGYTNNVSGLFQLANDVLGGANTSLPPLDVQLAVAAINNAFDGCRILTATIPFAPALVIKPRLQDESKSQKLSVIAFPNPFNKQFSLNITSPITGMANIEFFNLNGAKISELKKFIPANISTIVLFSRQLAGGSVLYKVIIGNYEASGIVVGVE